MDSKQMEEYIKWAVFELACNGGIDHRNYDGETRESKLRDYMGQFNSADQAVSQVSQQLVSDKTFGEFYEQYLAAGDDCDDCDDDNFDLVNEFFNYVVEFVGLCEIFNLHEDDRDNFQTKFLSFI